MIDSVIRPEECAVALNNTYGARPVQQEIAAGAGVQLLLLALLGSVTGLGPAGWLAGLAFAVAGWATLSRALRRSGLRPFGPANRVTLGRATLAGGVTALVADSFAGSPPVAPLVGLTAVALVLDGVDGRVARRTGTSSAFGARFDMEVDAFLILVLSVYVSMELGPWVLLIGGMRYAFVAAARFLPWLDAPLPPSTARKAVAAVQGVFLLVAGGGADAVGGERGGGGGWRWDRWCGRSGGTCGGCGGPRGSGGWSGFGGRRGGGCLRGCSRSCLRGC
ncbi:hypothetical protein GCM10020295_13250 [Streptomyces cinereospinus]